LFRRKLQSANVRERRIKREIRRGPACVDSEDIKILERDVRRKIDSPVNRCQSQQINPAEGQYAARRARCNSIDPD